MDEKDVHFVDVDTGIEEATGVRVLARYSLADSTADTKTDLDVHWIYSIIGTS